MRKLKIADKATVFRKTVFLRADTDVPVSNGVVIDDTRLDAGIPTITAFLSAGTQVVIGGHLGRPEGVSNKKYSLLPVANWYGSKMNLSVVPSTKNGFLGWAIGEQIFFLENLRFFTGEEKNEPSFAKALASFSKVYVDDAFAVSHRKEASNVGITSYLPSFAGFRFAKEIDGLQRIIDNPKRPLVVVIGGAKIETKLPLVEKMHDFADFVLVGGKIAKEVTGVLKKQSEKTTNNKSVLLIANTNDAGDDITSESVDNFTRILHKAKTIVWNGPLGKTNENTTSRFPSEKGTEKIAEVIADATLTRSCYTVVGGGDTLAFLKKVHLINKYSFYSTGGGAMLSFLAGEDLPGVTVLLSK